MEDQAQDMCFSHHTRDPIRWASFGLAFPGPQDFSHAPPGPSVAEHTRLMLRAPRDGHGAEASTGAPLLPGLTLLRPKTMAVSLFETLVMLKPACLLNLRGLVLKSTLRISYCFISTNTTMSSRLQIVLSALAGAHNLG